MKEVFEENIGLLIHDVGRLLRVLYDRQMASIGLTRSQWLLLTYLFFKDGINQKELASLMDMEKAPLSRLLDRMEIIRLPGYTEDEKASIADKYLLPKQLKMNGLNESELSVSKKTILDVIRYFTREAGVRALEREIAKICRKAIKKIGEATKPKKIYLVTIKYTPGVILKSVFF